MPCGKKENVIRFQLTRERNVYVKIVTRRSSVLIAFPDGIVVR